MDQSNVIAVAVLLAATLADPVCVVVNQIGVVRGAPDPYELRTGYPFPCYLPDEEALYRYRHGLLAGQEATGLWRGFDPGAK